MDIFDAIARDANVSPAFRRVVANPKKDYLETAADKAAKRRFTAEPLTGFGGIDEIGSDRCLEVRDEERADDLADERRAAMARGE